MARFMEMMAALPTGKLAGEIADSQTVRVSSALHQSCQAVDAGRGILVDVHLIAREHV